MTMDSGQPATSAVPGVAGGPPAKGMVMRRSRSLSELPGSLRVPIIARRGDGERMRVRLEASREGLEELKMLREQQQQLVDQVKAAASQRRGSNGRQTHARRASTSMRSSTASLARISEDGPLDTSVAGNLGARDESLRDFTNLPVQGWGDWRSTQTGRSRRPLSMSDSCFLEGALYVEAEQGRGGGGVGGLGGSSSLRKVRSLDSFGPDRSNVPAAAVHPSPRRASTQGLYGLSDSSYREPTSTSPSHHHGQYRTFAGMAAASDGGLRASSFAHSSPAGSTLSLHRAGDAGSDYAEHEAVATFEGKVRKVGRSHSFSLGPGPSLGVGSGLGSSTSSSSSTPRVPLEPPRGGGPILPPGVVAASASVALETLCDSENMEPKLRRASLQCEAVLTGSSGRQRDVFRDVDIRCDFPSPLHAVLRQYSGSRGSLSSRPDLSPQPSPAAPQPPSSQALEKKTSLAKDGFSRDSRNSYSGVSSAANSAGSSSSSYKNRTDASVNGTASLPSSPVMTGLRSQNSLPPAQSTASSSTMNAFSPGMSSQTLMTPRYQDTRKANRSFTEEYSGKNLQNDESVPSLTSSSQTTVNASVAIGYKGFLTNDGRTNVSSSMGLQHVASCPATLCSISAGEMSGTRMKEPAAARNGSSTRGDRSCPEGGGPRYTSCTTGNDARLHSSDRRYSAQGRDMSPAPAERQATLNDLEGDVSKTRGTSHGDAPPEPRLDEKSTSRPVDVKSTPQSRPDSQNATEWKADGRREPRKDARISSNSDSYLNVETPRSNAKRLRVRSLNEVPEALRERSYRSGASTVSDENSSQQSGGLEQNPETSGQQGAVQEGQRFRQESQAISGDGRNGRWDPHFEQRSPEATGRPGPSPPQSPSDINRGENDKVNGTSSSPTPRSSSDDVFESPSGPPSHPSSPGHGAAAETSSSAAFYPENPEFRIQDWYSVGGPRAGREGSSDDVFLEDQTTTSSGCRLVRARTSPISSSSSSSQLGNVERSRDAEQHRPENRRSNGGVPSQAAAPRGHGTAQQQRSGPQSPHPDSGKSASNGNGVRLSSSETLFPSSSMEATESPSSSNAPFQSPRESKQGVDASSQGGVSQNANSASTLSDIARGSSSPLDNQQSTPVANRPSTPPQEVYCGSSSSNNNNNNSNNNGDKNGNGDDRRADGLHDNTENVRDLKNSSNNNYIGPTQTLQRPPFSSTNPFAPQSRTNTNPFTNQSMPSANPFLSQPLSPTNPFIQPPPLSTNPFVQQPLSPTNPFASQLNASRAREGISCKRNPSGSHQDEGYITSSPETPRGRHFHKHSFLSDSSATSAEMDESPPRGEATPCFEPSNPATLPADNGRFQGDAQQAANESAGSRPDEHGNKASLPFRQTDL